MDVSWQINGMWVVGRVRDSSDAGKNSRRSGGNLLPPAAIKTEGSLGTVAAFRTQHWGSVGCRKWL